MKLTLAASAVALLCASPVIAQTQGTNQPDALQNQQTEPQKDQQQTGSSLQGAQLRTTFVNTSGEEIGTATLKETSQGVLISAELNGLPPGLHAFHIHETGVCDPQNGFESAGSHYAPDGSEHGYEASGGPHAGDLPNQNVGQDGVLNVEVLSHMTMISEGEAPLLDNDGSALVVHSGIDDYSSQPSGDAGDRIACAPVTQEQQQAMRTGSQQEAGNTAPDAVQQ